MNPVSNFFGFTVLHRDCYVGSPPRSRVLGFVPTTVGFWGLVFLLFWGSAMVEELAQHQGGVMCCCTWHHGPTPALFVDSGLLHAGIFDPKDACTHVVGTFIAPKLLMLG